MGTLKSIAESIYDDYDIAQRIGGLRAPLKHPRQHFVAEVSEQMAEQLHVDEVYELPARLKTMLRNAEPECEDLRRDLAPVLNTLVERVGKW